MARFQITLIRPSGYVHTDCFKEVAETVMYGLRALGHQADIRENYFSRNAWNIVLGAHLLPNGFALPSYVCLYNLEQYGAEAFEKLFALEWAPDTVWWDYSKTNLHKMAMEKVVGQYVPIGYMPEISRIISREQDIPVLFIGSMNERRREVINRLIGAGIQVHWEFPVYGKERDELVSRSKLVLNVHFYDAGIFEIVRCSYLMANKVPILSEASNEIDEDIRDGISEAGYNGLVDACQYFLEYDLSRHNLGRRGFEAIKARDEKKILEAALDGANLEISEEATAT